MDYVPKPDPEGINAPEKENHLKDVTILVAGFLALLFTAYYSLGFISDYLLTRMSLESEIKWFQKMEAKSEKDLPEALQKLVDQISSRQSFPLNVSVLCMEEKNAFAFLGGKIFLTSGLIESLKSENAIAFVIGHEIGHIIHRDNVKGLGRAVIAQVISGFLGISDLSGAQTLNSMMVRSYGREAERKADQYGLDLLTQVYGHTWGAEEFFEMMSKEETAAVRTLSRFASTHPPSSDRLQFVKATQVGEAKDLSPRTWTPVECPKK